MNEPAPVSRRTNRGIWVVLLVGLAVRLVVAPWTSHAADDSVWYQATVTGMHRIGLYSRLEFAYPPVWGYLLQGIGRTLSHIGFGPERIATTEPRLFPAVLATRSLSTTVTSPAFTLVFKLVLVAFDLATAFLLRSAVFRLCGRDGKGRRAARRAFMLWWLNPLVIFEVCAHGAADVIIAFSILLTIVLLLDGRDAWAGAAFAFGVLSKVSPIFVGPVIVAFIVASPSARHGIRRLMMFAGGAGLTATILLAPIVVSGQLHGMLRASTARVQSGATVGGVSVFGLKNLRPLSWLPEFANTHRSALGLATTGLQMLVAIGVAVWVLRGRRGDMTFRVVAGIFVTLAFVISTTPIANPQWLLWFTPEIVLLVAAWELDAWPVALVASSATVFDLALVGPAAFAAPAAKTLGLPSMTTLSTAVVRWQQIGTPFWATTGRGAVLALCELLILGSFAGLVFVITRPARTRPDEPSTNSRATRPVMPLAIVVVVIVVTLLAGIVTNARPDPSEVQVTAARDASQIDVHAQGRLDGSTSHLRLVALPVRDAVQANVAVYVDKAYPLLWTDLRAANGIRDHLRSELVLHDYAGKITTVDAAQLARLLRDVAPARRTIVVMMAGVFPAEVFSTKTDLVGPWVRAGGRLLWGGPAPGLWSARPNRALSSGPGSVSAGQPGVNRLLGPGFLATPPDPQRFAQTPTPFSSALGLSYQETGLSLLTTSARAGRVPLGYTASGRSSISLVRLGAGAIVMFEGPILDEQIVARDASRLILSGAIASIGPPQSHDVDGSAVSAAAGVVWRFRAPPATVAVSIFDPDAEGVVFARRTVDR